MSTEETAVEERRRPPVAVVVTLLTAILTVLLIAFAWPAARSEPRDLPIAVAGPAQAVAQVQGGLEQAMPGGFEITAVADRASAVQAIEDRDVYGAIVLDPQSPEVLTASAGGPAVAQILVQLSSRLAADNPGVQTKVTDVVPLPADDPRGAGLAAGALPLVLGGILAAALLTQLVKGGSQRMVGAIAFAITGCTRACGRTPVLAGLFGGQLPRQCRRDRDVDRCDLADLARPGVAARHSGSRPRCRDDDAARQPAVRADQRAGNAAQRLGHARPVPAAGSSRYCAALGQLLRRSRFGAPVPGPRLLARARSRALRTGFGAQPESARRTCPSRGIARYRLRRRCGGDLIVTTGAPLRGLTAATTLSVNH